MSAHRFASPRLENLWTGYPGGSSALSHSWSPAMAHSMLRWASPLHDAARGSHVLRCDAGFRKRIACPELTAGAHILGSEAGERRAQLPLQGAARCSHLGLHVRWWAVPARHRGRLSPHCPRGSIFDLPASLTAACCPGGVVVVRKRTSSQNRAGS